MWLKLMITPLSYCVVAKFEPPDDFLSQLESQVYGPTTQLIASDVSVTSVSRTVCAAVLLPPNCAHSQAINYTTYIAW